MELYIIMFLQFLLLARWRTIVTAPTAALCVLRTLFFVTVWVAVSYPADPGFTLFDVVWCAVAFPAHLGLFVFWTLVTLVVVPSPQQDCILLFSLGRDCELAYMSVGDPCGPPVVADALTLRAELGGAFLL
jgi:hypothetical protein